MYTHDVAADFTLIHIVYVLTAVCHNRIPSPSDMIDVNPWRLLALTTNRYHTGS